MIAIPAVATRARSAKSLVWLFNIEGSLDLIVAIALATVYDAAPFMGPAYWIPAFWVPALLVTHYLTFLVLLRGRWADASVTTVTCLLLAQSGHPSSLHNVRFRG